MQDVDTGEIRLLLVKYARHMLASGLVTGTSGNLSARAEGSEIVAVTPSGVDYDTMQPEDLVLVDLAGKVVDGRLKPSIDTMNHLEIYRARPDVCSVIHTHSPYATAFATLSKPIPPLQAESAGYLGGAVRVMGYLPPASPHLAHMAADGLGRDLAVLLPNHGVIAVGRNIRQAYHAAVSVEESAHIAFLALQLGTPAAVSDVEITRIHEFIHGSYGQR